jgi:hypothetical protein
MKKKIPKDSLWKLVLVRGKSYLVPNFAKMRNKVRKKCQKKS